MVLRWCKGLGWQSGLAISNVAACLSGPNILSIDFASFQPLKSKHSPSKLVFGLYLCPTSILYSNLCPPLHPPPPPPPPPPHHPPNISTPESNFFIQLARFSTLFHLNIYNCELGLGKLSNTVKWSTVSFACSQSLAGHDGLKSFIKTKNDFQSAIWNVSQNPVSNPVLCLHLQCRVLYADW